MAEGLVELVRAFRAAVVVFEPGVYSGEDCAVLVEELATAENACRAARVRAAARAGACGAHRERGFADVSDWLARVSGSSSGSAKAALDATAALQEHPELKAALEAGELSMAQAQELAKTEASCPGSAASLLGVAKKQCFAAPGPSLSLLAYCARNGRVRRRAAA